MTTQNRAIYCKYCTLCDQVVRNHNLAAVLENCTSTSNTVCGCKPTHHFVPDHGGLGKGHCFENTKCPAGNGTIKKGWTFFFFFSTLVYLSKTICILTIVISPAIITRKSSCQLELLISLIFFKHRSLNTFDKKKTLTSM